MVATGAVTASGMTAGEWHGQYQFNVSLDAEEAESEGMYLLWAFDPDETTEYMIPNTNGDYTFAVTGVTVDGVEITGYESFSDIVENRLGFELSDGGEMNLLLPISSLDSEIVLSGHLKTIGGGALPRNGEEVSYTFSLSELTSSTLDMFGNNDELDFSENTIAGDTMWLVRSSSLETLLG